MSNFTLARLELSNRNTKAFKYSPAIKTETFLLGNCDEEVIVYIIHSTQMPVGLTCFSTVSR